MGDNDIVEAAALATVASSAIRRLDLIRTSSAAGRSEEAEAEEEEYGDAAVVLCLANGEEKGL